MPVITQKTSMAKKEETKPNWLVLDADGLGDDLRWEVSRGGALFPHLYRVLRASDVTSAHDLPLVGGAHDFGDLLR